MTDLPTTTTPTATTTRITYPAGTAATAAMSAFDQLVDPAADAGPMERLVNWTGRVTRSAGGERV